MKLTSIVTNLLNNHCRLEQTDSKKKAKKKTVIENYYKGSENCLFFIDRRSKRVR